MRVIFGKSPAFTASAIPESLTVAYPAVTTTTPTLTASTTSVGADFTISFLVDTTGIGTGHVFFKAMEGDGSNVIIVQSGSSSRIQVQVLDASGSLARRKRWTPTASSTIHVFIRFRASDNTLDVYEDGTLLTVFDQDNDILTADGAPEDFELFASNGGTATIAALGQFQYSNSFLDISQAWDAVNSRPYDFANFTTTPLIALGDDMTVAEWNNGTNRGSLTLTDNSGGETLTAGTPSSFEYTES